MNIPIVTLTFLDLLILALATLYSVQVVTTKAGPFGIFKRLRERYPDAEGGALFHCVWCLAPWVAVVLLAIYLFLPLGIYPVYVLAICGAAMALRTYTGVQHG